MKEQVVQTLLDVIRGLNRTRARDQQLEISANTVLTGEGGTLDSLGLISFIVAAEERIEDEFHTPLALAESLFSSDDGSLHTVGSLADYIATELDRQHDRK